MPVQQRIPSTAAGRMDRHNDRELSPPRRQRQRPSQASPVTPRELDLADGLTQLALLTRPPEATRLRPIEPAAHQSVSSADQVSTTCESYSRHDWMASHQRTLRTPSPAALSLCQRIMSSQVRNRLSDAFRCQRSNGQPARDDVCYPRPGWQPRRIQAGAARARAAAPGSAGRGGRAMPQLVRQPSAGCGQG